MAASEPITLSRECDVVEIPSGLPNKLPAGTVVRIMQNLGNTYTVFSDYAAECIRIDAKDADALGLHECRGGGSSRRRKKNPSPSRWSGIS